MTKKKSVILISLATLLIIAILVGVSYAYWKKSKVQTGVNVLELGCLDISITEEENLIHLTSAIPVSDEEGLSSTPFTFTVKNTCSTNLAYSINLESLSTTTLDLSFIDVVLDDRPIALFSQFTTVPAVNTGATAKTIGYGKLAPDQEESHNLRLWLDKDTTLAESQNKIFNAKVTVSAATIYSVDKRCIRATNIQTVTCDSLYSSGCTELIGRGNEFSYGNTQVTKGELNTGDAFICDINNDGDYNEQEERFYYVSPLYDTINSTADVAVWDEDVAVLIYSKNLYRDTVTGNLLSEYGNYERYVYNDSNNYTGIDQATIDGLPNITDPSWGTIQLVNPERQIRTQLGNSVNHGYDLPMINYKYNSARLLTYQEFVRACGGTSVNNQCVFLFDGLQYHKTNYLGGYWLENSSERNLTSAYTIATSFNGLATDDVNGEWNRMGGMIRPVIELYLDDIDY